MLQSLGQGGAIDGPKLGEYIACSAPLHLADGWNYLSQAFDAASRGDRSSAFHLAYYGELRAAMSLLAAEGVGVFNNRHIALDGSFRPMEFRKSTHRATWLLLSAWSGERGRAARLLQAIVIEPKNLSEWLADVGVVEPHQQLVAQEWLRAWSIDLDVLSADPERRNEMSYRPTRIRAPAPPRIAPRPELARPILDSWAELEPSNGLARATLDVALLRQALLLVVKKGICHYRTLDGALNALRQKIALEAGKGDDLYHALKSKSSSATAIFRDAEIAESRKRAAVPILARGLLMLRLAAASTAALLKAADISKPDLSFWWSALGTDLGLWETANDYDTFADLWSDVEDARSDAVARLSEIQGDGSVRDVSRILSQDVALTQFSRAPMWLLGLD